MIEFDLEYLVFVIFACLGALQLAAWRNHLKGLFLLPHRNLTGLLGALLVVGSFIWFFTSENRNVPDTREGLGGSLMFGLFVLGCALALAFTLAVSSLVNAALRREPPEHAEGVEALRESTYFQSLRSSLDRVRAAWRR